MICSLGNICTLFHVQFQVHCIAIISLGIDDNRYDTYTHSTHVYSRRIHISYTYYFYLHTDNESEIRAKQFVSHLFYYDTAQGNSTHKHTHSHMHEFNILTDK